MTVANFLSNSNLIWLPIVAFFLILVFAFATGFYKGWKSALYYLVFDWIAALIGVFVAGPILVSISGQIGANEINVANYAAQNPALAPLLLIIWIPIMRILSFTIHFFFLRKRFRAHLVNNEIASQVRQASWKTRFLKLNGTSRLIGASVSLLGAAPMAIFAANGAMLLSGNSFFQPFNDAMITATTFGLYDGTSKHAAGIRDYFQIVENDEINVLRRILIGEAVTGDELAVSFAQIQNLFKSDTRTLRGIFASLPPDSIGVEYIKAVLDSPDGLANLPQKFVMTNAEFTDFKNVLDNDFGWAELNDIDGSWAKIQSAFFTIVN